MNRRKKNPIQVKTQNKQDTPVQNKSQRLSAQPQLPLPIQKKIRLLKRDNGKVTFEIEEQYLQTIMGFLHNVSSEFSTLKDFVVKEDIQQDNTSESSAYISECKSRASNQNDIREIQDFYRRVPHFFMGRFKKWARIINDQEVYTYLQNLQTSKKSKQGRYELGDFHRSFQMDQNEPYHVQQIKCRIKELFLDFLQNEAVLQIISYNKITTLEQKNKYIKVIPLMVKQLYHDKPFDQFLSQDKIQEELNIEHLYPQPWSGANSSNMNAMRSEQIPSQLFNLS